MREQTKRVSRAGDRAHTEGALRALFDFQRFAANRRLEKVIRAAGAACDPGGTALEDDELEVFAAGDANLRRGKQDKDAP